MNSMLNRQVRPEEVKTHTWNPPLAAQSPFTYGGTKGSKLCRYQKVALRKIVEQFNLFERRVVPLEVVGGDEEGRDFELELHMPLLRVWKVFL